MNRTTPYDRNVDMSKEYDIFLSYPPEDRDWVRRLASALSEQGLCVWYDETGMKPGDMLLDRMEKGLRESSHVVFVIMPEAVQMCRGRTSQGQSG